MINKSAIPAALALTIGAASLHAGPMTSATFDMYDPTGALINTDTTVTGDIGSGTWNVASTTTFFGLNWTAHSGTTFGPGTYNFDTIQGGVYNGIVVGTGQIGGHILFDWGSTTDIDVINVWNEVCVPQATFLECTYTSIDGACASGPATGCSDSTPGFDMIDGAFPSFSANFDFVATFPLPGAPTFTAPANVNTTNTAITATPAIVSVPLGTVTDESPGSAVVEYSTDGMATWIVDDGVSNPENFNLTQTINPFTIDWRATNGGQTTFLTQTVTVTINDIADPIIDNTNAPAINVNVNSTSDSVCFGAISATDAIEPNLTIEWSHDGFNWNTANPDTGNLSDNCSTGFGPNLNTLNWRALDAAGNQALVTQDVTLNLPIGITGKACTIDLATAGPRLLEGQFTMRDPTGALAGTVDTGVLGNIDTTVFCPGPGTDLASCNPIPPAAALTAGQAFFGFTWTANPVRLFGQGTWDIETCPLPRTFDATSGDWISADGSTKCNDQFTPNLISMTVGPGQVGAHMLFTWSTNPNIDVVVVWDANCNAFELTTTDPDGDGLLSTPMVDGPFKGFNAAFDVKTQAGEPKIADGGYTTTIPTVQNPVAGESPIPVTPLPLPAFTADSAAVNSCVGGCYKFSTSNLLTATDTGGTYDYAQVVLPLSTATPFWSLYRKYDEVTSTWGPFVINGRNDVKTAPLDSATMECPEPGNGSYDRPISGALADKLRAGDMCVQLTIEDDGPNDAANTVAGTVADPGGVAEVPAAALPGTATGGGCSVSGTAVDPAKGGAWWLLTGLLGWLGWNRRRRS